MPNWCENKLFIIGEPAEIKRFIEQAKPKEDDDPDNTVLSFKNFYPVPEEEKTNWYHWCVENWGTKWDACYVDMESDGKNYLSFRFDTAWTPPTGVIEKMSELYPDLKFTMKYDEGGCAFMGVCTAENGIMEDKWIDYV